jgi:hypothetical protein
MTARLGRAQTVIARFGVAGPIDATRAKALRAVVCRQRDGRAEAG